MTKKILLLCAAGMSTSIIVKKMREVAEKHSLDVEINAVGMGDFIDNIPKYDIFLLGPQIKFKYEEFSEIVNPTGKKVMVIDSMDYGALRGDKILKAALVMLKGN
ncbi:PTS sugar transporter subunit IIB [Fusobacterium sp.]|uniref:PTS sugar transporter subunit IIB n=1 Tax=Fusobacterium sp. TaxID=68766 RepID=UPI002618E3DE|nr:PTS sugar transporter subunit IIB [Fusobacterium sp.]